jgi:ELWxxDGT repeat protein
MRRPFRIVQTIIVISLLVPAAFSGGPQLVGDINPSILSSSYPEIFASTGTAAYFVASDLNNFQLWTSDGTAEGTHMVRVIAPPHFDTIIPDANFTASGSMVFFFVDDSISLISLWRTDGTAQGTIQLTASSFFCDDGPITPLGANKVVFLPGYGNCGLWTSDGTSVGTRQIQAFQGGGIKANAGVFPQLVPAGSSAFFTASGLNSSTDLWITDGTESGTRMVKQMPNDAYALSASGGKAIVFGRGANGGVDIWQSDGTTTGTALVKHIDDFYINDAVATPGGTYFNRFTLSKGVELWRTDGTDAGTMRIRDVTGQLTALRIAQTANGVTFFIGFQDGSKQQLWRTDGSAAGTYSLIDASGSTNPAGAISILAAGPTHAYFSICCGPTAGLWTSDGSTTGTSLLGPVQSTTPYHGPPSSVAIGDSLIFGGNDGQQTELWRSDGTSATTRQIVNIHDDGNSYPGHFGRLGNILLFSAFDQHGYELWRSDGTASGTTLVKDINPGQASASPSALTTVGSVVLFVADDGVHGRELWRTDGTPQGTQMVKDINPTGSALTVFLVDAPFMTVLNEIAYFQATVGGKRGLWRSDGTDGGTYQISPNGYGPVVYDNAIFFSASDGIWRTDGTLAGTKLVAPLQNVGQPAVAGSKLFFAHKDITTGTELWSMSGPTASPQLVKDINPGPHDSLFDPTAICVDMNGTLIFTAFDDAHGMELWRSDGTADGTQLVKDINPGTSSSFLFGFEYGQHALLGSTLFFVADDGVHGRELWASDGTTAGTRMVKDIAPGPLDAWPDYLVTAGGRVWFAAYDPDHGRELWSTNGTDTTLYDISPGQASSVPEWMFPFDDTLYFSATTAATGDELWKLSLVPRRRPAKSLEN